MNLTPQQIAASLDSIAKVLNSAETALANLAVHHVGDEFNEYNAKWFLEVGFRQLLVVTEALDLPLLHATIAGDLERAQSNDFLALEVDPAGNPSLKWGTPAWMHLRTLRATFGVDSERTVTRDLEAILREAAYSITDPRVHRDPPANEKELHYRLENLLRAVFPVLLHKPRLAKAIKNFEPDTGIPSIQTLVEYKYLSNRGQVDRIADELLADTRGYTSKEWNSFFYVIYETHRIKPESEWRQLMRDCNVGASASVVVVISGEPKPEKRDRDDQEPQSNKA